MKISIFETEPWQEKIFKKSFPKTNFCSKKLTSSNVKKYKDTEILSVFVHSKIDQKVLKQLPKLKYIATMSTGFDHIDLNVCKERKIVVSNVPTYGENTVAEQTFALILALSRKITTTSEQIKKGNFKRDNLRGFDLKEKVLGVIGTGNIGKHSIMIAKGLGMKILAFDLYQDKKFASSIGFKYVKMEQLLHQSDLITLHLPYNKHTHHLINKSKIKIMKKGVYLINTARGSLIDTDALYSGLKLGKIAGAGLDVLEEEQDLLSGKKFLSKESKKILRMNKEIVKMPNVIFSPHNAYNTKEALIRIINTTIKNIKQFKKGKKINIIK
jgi:D-lactate dehydrogenase